ncbi:MAG TPA: FxLYD domain-containing protein [Methylomirabilota bacterium]|jgi:hypothetical protein|nr:FxLYD domain-containing protein [Methylomirabilota bacterium]
MNRTRDVVVAALLALLAAPVASHAQTATDGARPFRVTWERRAYGVRPALEGEVANDSEFRINSVRLRIEGFDDDGQPVGETSTWAFGSIPAHGQGHFVAPAIPRATTYRITVTGFNRVAREDVQSP